MLFNDLLVGLSMRKLVLTYWTIYMYITPSLMRNYRYCEDFVDSHRYKSDLCDGRESDACIFKVDRIVTAIGIGSYSSLDIATLLYKA